MMDHEDYTHAPGTSFLAEVGEVLMRGDEKEELAVFRGGVIGRAHADRGDHEPSAAKDVQDEQRQVPRGPEAGQGEGSAAREGTSPQGPPFVGVEGLDPGLAGRLEELALEYPDFSLRPAPSGVWVLTRIEPILELEAATVLSMLSPKATRPPWVLSWAWWDSSDWIGPRHTNYPDGSICAFEDGDGSWSKDESLLPLWDMYSLWVTRHLHLRHFGYWPGRQVLHTAYERLNEQQDQELCGGCRSGLPYGECHRPLDERIDSEARRREALLHGFIGPRTPPSDVIETLRELVPDSLPSS